MMSERRGARGGARHGGRQGSGVDQALTEFGQALTEFDQEFGKARTEFDQALAEFATTSALRAEVNPKQAGSLEHRQETNDTGVY